MDKLTRGQRVFKRLYAGRDKTLNKLSEHDFCIWMDYCFRKALVATFNDMKFDPAKIKPWGLIEMEDNPIK